MSNDKFKTGLNVLDDDPGVIAREIISSGDLALVRTDGEVHLLNQRNMMSMDVHNRDLLLAPQHRDIIAFVARAIHLGIFEKERNHILHIDLQENPGIGADEVDDILPFERIEGYVEGAKDMNTVIAFFRMLELIEKDIISVPHYIRSYFTHIAACIRKRFAEKTLLFPPMYEGKYFYNQGRRHFARDESLDYLVSENRFQLFSINGEFCGVNREFDPEHFGTFDPASKNGAFERRLDLLLRAMSHEVDRIKWEVQEGLYGGKTLFTASYNPETLVDPDQFVTRFLDEFYKKIVEAYAA